MSSKTSIFSLASALVLAAGSGILYLKFREATQQNALLSASSADLSQKLLNAQAEIDRLKDQLARASLIEKELQGKVVALTPASLKQGDEALSPSEAAKMQQEPTAPPRKISLAAIDQAEALANELISKGDLEGLWLLAAELLSLGEEGYDKIIELASLLEKEMDNHDSSSMLQLWNKEELFMGSFFHAIASHHEELLRFLLYLNAKSATQEFPKFISEVNQSALPEMGPVLLGFYQGDNQELLHSFTEIYRQQLGNNNLGDGKTKNFLLGLGQIHTDEANQLLLDTLPQLANDQMKKVAISALAWQRNEKSLPVLREMLETTPNQELAESIRMAIKYLE